MTKRVLDLGAIFDRDTVKMLDGTEYELRDQQEFGVLDDHRLRALIEKITQFHARAAEATEQEAEQASKMLRELADMIVVNAADAEIADWACAQIFEFWMTRAAGEAPANPRKRPRDRKRSTRKRTTAASSRASKRSTAVTRKRGSKTSRPGR